MKEALLALFIVFLMVCVVTWGLVEIYRIEMDSYDRRMTVFYGLVFEYMNGTVNDTGVMPF